MNYILNDKNESVVAFGAPGSIARCRVQYPALIERLNAFYNSAFECPGKCLDKAIEMIREVGISNESETNAILSNTHYQ